MDNLAFLRAMTGAFDDDDAKPEKSYPLPEAQIETLRELSAAYQANPFKVGDLVTPRKGVNVKGAGKPHLIVETMDEPIRPFDHEDGHSSCGFGAKLDIRVISYAEPEAIVAYWMESWQLEPYVG